MSDQEMMRHYLEEMELDPCLPGFHKWRQQTFEKQQNLLGRIADLISMEDGLRVAPRPTGFLFIENYLTLTNRKR